MAIKPYLNFRFLFFILAIALGLGLLLFPPASLSPEESKTAALVIIIISSWATGIFPEHLTALFFFFFAMLFSVAPAQVIFSGFGTTVFWLVFGILKALVLIVLILMLYPDKPQKNKTEKLITIGPISQKETVLSGIIILLLALWMTDFIHMISPAWISLGGAILLLLPGIQIVGSREFNEKINFGSLFYLAGVLGVGGLVSHSGLGDVLANKLITSLPFSADKPFLNYVLLLPINYFWWKLVGGI